MENQLDRECSPATKIKSDLKASLKLQQSKENQKQNDEEQNSNDKKCNTCRERFNKCKDIILENPQVAFKDLLKLIKLKHRHPSHKQIEEESVLLISDFLAESEDFGKLTRIIIYI